MRVEFLGTGGAMTIPRPLCECHVCAEARQKGLPYSRTGPSVFVHGPDLLIDTPEEINVQLARSQLSRVAAGIYSHVHPDHIMGRRVWEMNQDFGHWPPRNRPATPVYLPQQVALDAREWLGFWDHLAFFHSQGLIELHEMTDGEVLRLDGHTIRPVRLTVNSVYAFLIEDGHKRLLVAMDELTDWDPPEFVQGVDLAVLPMGIVEHDPVTGERLIPADHPDLQSEAKFAETIEVARRLSARRTILTHIECQDGLGHDDLRRLAAHVRTRGVEIEFAHDTLQVDV